MTTPKRKHSPKEIAVNKLRKMTISEEASPVLRKPLQDGLAETETFQEFLLRCSSSSFYLSSISRYKSFITMEEVDNHVMDLC